MARTKKVDVRYIGPGVVRRVVDDYVWDAGNGYVCAVAEKDVQALLDNGDFEIVNQAPETPATEEKDGE